MSRAWGIRGIWLALALVLVLLWSTPTAWASIHTYPEGAEQVMYRSLQTLRDRRDQAWQVVLFKRVQSGQVVDLHLRLVGFPGVTELEHPHTLRITTGTEQVWEVAEASTEGSIAPNVGEYDLREVLLQLNSNTPLRLQLPTNGQAEELLVPPFVVQEWRRVLDLLPLSVG